MRVQPLGICITLGSVTQARPQNEGAEMPSDDDDVLNAARRMAYLVSLGIHSRVFDAAIDRSVDGQDFRQILGFIEDLMDMGCEIIDPE